MPIQTGSPEPNRLLHALSSADRNGLLDASEAVQLDFSQVICAPGQHIDHVYFPLDSFISLLAELDDGNSVEVGMIGREGMFGMDLVLGVAESGVRAIVQGAGSALRVPAAAFRAQLESGPALRRLMNRYSAVLIAQLTRTSACNGFHKIDQRLARWLLMCADRSSSDRIHLTQRFLAYMLGVRRVGVTLAASDLQERRLIDYTRGRIRILDRQGLQAMACSCYQADLDAYARLLGRAQASET